MTASAAIKTTPFLSVVTITYRDPLGLNQTLASLFPLHEMGLEWEHIVVDSSPEENQDLLKSLPSDWPLTHSKQPARGIYPAMNHGLELSTGELIWFLNGGDRLKDIKTLTDILETFKADSALDILCAGAHLYREGQYLYPRIPRKTFIRNILGSNQLYQQAVLYRRQSILKVGKFDESFPLASDYQHYIRAYLAGLKASFIPQILVNYDMGGASTNVTKALVDIARVHETMAPLYPFPLGHLDKAIAFYEDKRVRFVKAASNSPFGKPLRKLWLLLHRM